jgi:hypothetical protein
MLPMNADQVLDRMGDIFDRCLEISAAKNQDYADYDDPFKNFRAVETLGISATDGILTRMSDKLSRLGNLTRRDAAVNDESIYDTIKDFINYLALLHVMHEQAQMAEADGFDPFEEVADDEIPDWLVVKQNGVQLKRWSERNADSPPDISVVDDDARSFVDLRNVGMVG